jgi:hypothetical protein
MYRKKERFVREKIASLYEFINTKQLIVFLFLVQNLSNVVKTRSVIAVFSENGRTYTIT